MVTGTEVMYDTRKYYRGIFLCAVLTPFCLIGGMILGFALGNLTFSTLPGHIRETSRMLLAAAPAMAGMISGGIVWGWSMAKILGNPSSWRAALAGSAGFGITTILVAMLLSRLEFLFVEQGGGPQLPIHQLFTLLFVPAAAIISGVTATAFGFGLGRGRESLKMGAACALASGLAFLIVNVTMDAMGWVVGAPGAAERATMITVMFSGDLAAAISGGAVIGVLAGKQQVSADARDS